MEIFDFIGKNYTAPLFASAIHKWISSTIHHTPYIYHSYHKTAYTYIHIYWFHLIIFVCTNFSTLQLLFSFFLLLLLFCFADLFYIAAATILYLLPLFLSYLINKKNVSYNLNIQNDIETFPIGNNRPGSVVEYLWCAMNFEIIF